VLGKAPRRDDGLTLIELVITISIMGIIGVVLIGVLFEYVQNANQTSTRLAESPDQQFISTYLQQDVSSTGLRGTPTSTGSIPSQASIWLSGSGPSGVPGGCSGIANQVIGFAWTDYLNASTTDGTATWTASTSAAVYSTRTATNSNGTTQYQLWRTSCVGSSVKTTQLARYLTAVPTITCSSTCTSATLPATVSMTITVQDLGSPVHTSTGYTTTMTAERRQG